jgi:hypothetical protein
MWTRDCINYLVLMDTDMRHKMKTDGRPPRDFRQRFLDGPERSSIRQEANRVRGKRLNAFKKRYGTLILGASLAVGGAGIPLKAGKVTTPYPENESRSTLTQVTAGITAGLGSVAAGVELAVQLDPREADRQLAMLTEQAREDFFRSEIPFGELIYLEATRQGVEPELVAAVVNQESRFKPTARSPVGAQGLMQLMPRTGAWMGARNLNDPTQNVRAGVKYLKYLEERFNGNETLILAAYNGGEGNVKKYGGTPPFRETRNYVVKVADYKKDYQEQVAGRVAELVEETNPLLSEHLATVAR